MSDETPEQSPEQLAELGRQLMAEREAAGLSQSEAARRADIARATLISWEKGARPPSPDLLARLRAVYRGETVDVSRGTGAANGEGDAVRVSRETIGYIRGKLETTVAWLGSVEGQMGALGTSVHAVGETLHALRGTLDKATSGVAGLLNNGAIPAPIDLPAGWTLSPLREPQTLEELAEIERRIAEIRHKIETAVRVPDGRGRASGE
jgi:transcriptional regulator with XRE-family HTH domain